MHLPDVSPKGEQSAPRLLQHHYDGWIIAVVAMGILLPTIIIFCAISVLQKDMGGFYLAQDIIGTFAFLLGLLGLLLYIARIRHWSSLPHSLTLHGDGKETNMRLLVISLIAIFVPFILILLHHLI